MHMYAYTHIHTHNVIQYKHTCTFTYPTHTLTHIYTHIYAHMHTHIKYGGKFSRTINFAIFEDLLSLEN